MQIKKEVKKDCYAVKITAEENGQIIGRAFLYLIHNDLHEEPYGLVEDVFVDEAARGSGAGTKLVQAIIAEAKARGCKKLIANSRHERPAIHKWYEKLGFRNYGLEFRMDFK